MKTLGVYQIVIKMSKESKKTILARGAWVLCVAFYLGIYWWYTTEWVLYKT